MKRWIDHLFWKRTWFRFVLLTPVFGIGSYMALARMGMDDGLARDLGLFTYLLLFVVALYDNGNMDGADHDLRPWKREQRSTQPAPAWLRALMGPVVGWMTYHANRAYRTHSWYETKDRVVARYGVDDGCDVQVIPSVVCGACGGNGRTRVFDRMQTCIGCSGNGKRTEVRYVRLVRSRVGSYVFHRPTTAAAPTELMQIDSSYWANRWAATDVIVGYIRHEPGPVLYQLGKLCRYLLMWGFHFDSTAVWHWRGVVYAPHRWWETQCWDWYCGRHWLQRMGWPSAARKAALARNDDDLPF